MTKWGVKGHHVVRPPLVQSGLEVVPDDEYTFRDSRPRACASQDRMGDRSRAFALQEVQGKKTWRRAAMGADLEEVGRRVCRGSGKEDIRNESGTEGEGDGQRPVNSSRVDSLKDCKG